MIRVALADDHQLVRAGFRALLDSEPDIEVVVEASGGEALLRAIRETPVDVALLGIRMPDGDGLWTTEQIAADPALSGVRVVIVTTFELDEYVARAIRAGASGFLVKDTDPVDLIRAVRVVMRRRRAAVPRCDAAPARAGGARNAGCRRRHAPGRPHRARDRSAHARRSGAHERRDRPAPLPVPP